MLLCIIDENNFHLELKLTLTERKIVAALKSQGFKLTPQRRAVIRAIASSHDHLTPAAICNKVQKTRADIGLVTIYRTLEMLDRLGLICEVHAPGNRRSFLVRRPQEHHHHLICAGCGVVIDFTDCDLAKLGERLQEETGFSIESHLLEFLGRCRACQRVS